MQILVYLLIGMLCISLPLPFSVSAASVSITISDDTSGTTPKYIGFNQGHFMPGSNTTGWIEYSGTNAFRLWAAPTYYEPTDDLAPWGDGVTDENAFELRKAALRSDPESTTFINWPYFQQRFDTVVQSGVNKCVLTHMLEQLSAIGVDVMVVMNRKGWSVPGSWADKWEYWQFFYAMAYHMAKNYDVTMYQMYNEPDHTSNTMTQDDYMDWLRFSSDAVRCAIADVNERYQKSLLPKLLAPVITHSSETRGDYHMDADPDKDPRDDKTGWGQKAMEGIRTDYRGQTTDHNIFDVFDTHKYGKIGSDYTYELRMLRRKMETYSPVGEALPVIYSEFNRYGTGQWRSLSVDLNSPQVFTDLALIYGHAISEGVYGMIAFKFSNTESSTYGAYKTGFHYVWDWGKHDIGGTTKGAEVVRLVAKGFINERLLHRVSISSSLGSYPVFVSSDDSNYYILTVNTNVIADRTLDIDLQALALPDRVTAVVEEVSSDCHGGVSHVVELTQSPKRVSLVQPRQSVWLITIPKSSQLTSQIILPVADSSVRGGDGAQESSGGSRPWIQVGSGLSMNASHAGYLKFDLSVTGSKRIERAILQLHGQMASPTSKRLLLHVYGLTDSDWSEASLTWDNAPNLQPGRAAIMEVGRTAFPLGTLEIGQEPGIVSLDVTQLLNKVPRGGECTLVIVRETRYLGDTDREDTLALFGSRESATPPALVVWY